MEEMNLVIEKEVLGKDFKMYGDIDNPLFLAKDISTWLDHSDTSKMVKSIDEDEKLMRTLFLSGQNREVLFLTEDGFYEVLMLSRMPIAKSFKKEVKKILKEIRLQGKFNPVENKIRLIEDETERNLSLALYNMKEAQKANPLDTLTGLFVHNKQVELTQYIQDRSIKLQNSKLIQLETKTNEVLDKVDRIDKQQVFICNRTNFNERVKILANKCFGRDYQQTYKELFDTVKMLGSFDVYSRRSNEWEVINADRGKLGKAPYKNNTLKKKVGFLDVIEKYNKWELLSEAYKMVETKHSF